ncbi:MAG TPA: PqqD family protein [Magnetospirillum sp.]|nr:PqqD family protein [Magnetospirillum sp.]
MTTATITLSSTIRRNPDMLVAEIDNQVVMMSVVAGEYYGFDDICSDIWRYLSRPMAVSELAEILAADYDAPRNVIESDLLAVLAEMSGKTLIQAVA